MICHTVSCSSCVTHTRNPALSSGPKRSRLLISKRSSHKMLYLEVCRLSHRGQVELLPSRRRVHSSLLLKPQSQRLSQSHWQRQLPASGNSLPSSSCMAINRPALWRGMDLTRIRVQVLMLLVFLQMDHKAACQISRSQLLRSHRAFAMSRLVLTVNNNLSQGAFKDFKIPTLLRSEVFKRLLG